MKKSKIKTKKKIDLNDYAVIDCETWGLDANPEAFALGCFYSNDETFFETDVNKFRERIFASGKKNIFAHNSEYDYNTIFGNIFLNLDNAPIMKSGLFIRAEKDGKIFLNSLAVLKTSVESLGKSLGIKKGITPDKFIHPDNNNKIITKKDIEYCFRDCEIVYNYLKKIFTKSGKINITIASAAMTIFKNKFGGQRYINNSFNSELFRRSYLGGRVECFQLKKIMNVNKYDVNSLYPHVAANITFPYLDGLKPLKKFQHKDILEIINKYDGLAELTVSHVKSHIGCLPIVHNRKMVFPVGEFSGCWNFNELRAALATGLVKITEVGWGYYSSRIKIDALKKYVKHFYEEKKNSKGAEQLIAKYLLNALTGKFAEKRPVNTAYFKTSVESSVFIKKNENKIESYSFKHFSDERDDLYVEFVLNKTAKRGYTNCPMISSYICSAARAFMLPHYISQGENLIYTDTDSIITTSPLNTKLMSNNEMGLFKKEKENGIEVRGNKNYTTYIDGEFDEEKIKGISKKNTVKQADGSYIITRMMKSKESLRRKMTSGKFFKLKKVLKQRYDKRILHKDGSTSPIKF